MSSNRRLAVSLFSNCGAGDVGYAAAGFQFRVMAELDPRRLEVALLNHPGAVGVPGDIRATWPRVVDAFANQANDELELLAACPPCQGMSTARSGRGRGEDADSGSRDGRNLLVLSIISTALALRPKSIVVENVRAFLTRKVRDPVTGDPVSAAVLLVRSLEHLYEWYPLLTDFADFGVPQTRRRTLITLLRRDLGKGEWLTESGRIPYPIPRPRRTLGDALARMALRPLDARSQDCASDPAEPLHRVPVWPSHVSDMVEAIPPGSGRSAWMNDACPSCGRLAAPNLAACQACGSQLLRPSVVADGALRLVKGFKNSSYRRMAPDRPAATITTASGRVGSDLTLHPSETRVMSPLELALLQTFPLSFEWGSALQTQGHTRVRAMIGEAVPPRFTYLHGRALTSVLDSRGADRLMSSNDAGFQRARDRLSSALEPRRESIGAHSVSLVDINADPS